ncbi:hypothetical protein L6452_19179 [Arctium lappa]|uniref:Uncharacterized protein n=1 Tax=Arctium lappa TaxID=4217 RepID=A0ACB9BCB4_ARCLA|nr:hypothetical protein L6452_19179 [Arctium lappa]
MASGSGGPAKPTTTTEASSCTETFLKRNSGDAGWNYVNHNHGSLLLVMTRRKWKKGGNSEAKDHESRELHEDDFESDEEPQVEGDEEFEFISDDERLLDIIDDDNME